MIGIVAAVDTAVEVTVIVVGSIVVVVASAVAAIVAVDIVYMGLVVVALNVPPLPHEQFSANRVDASRRHDTNMHLTHLPIGYRCHHCTQRYSHRQGHPTRKMSRCN